MSVFYVQSFFFFKCLMWTWSGRIKIHINKTLMIHQMHHMQKTYTYVMYSQRKRVSSFMVINVKTVCDYATHKKKTFRYELRTYAYKYLQQFDYSFLTFCWRIYFRHKWFYIFFIRITSSLSKPSTIQIIKMVLHEWFIYICTQWQVGLKICVWQMVNLVARL